MVRIVSVINLRSFYNPNGIFKGFQMFEPKGIFSNAGEHVKIFCKKLLKDNLELGVKSEN